MFCYHTHSNYCDGSDEPEKYIEAALKAGFHSLGFSSHAPVPFDNGFAIKDKQSLMNYCNEIRELQDKYKDRINIFLALEIDYIPGLMDDFLELRNSCNLDYIIGSVHLVSDDTPSKLWFIDGPIREKYIKGLKELFSGDIKKAVTSFYHQTNQMIETQKPDIIGHMDKIKMHNKGMFFREDEKWYTDLVDETLDVIREHETVVEVNTRGIYKGRSDSLYPGVDVLKKILRRGIPITLSADAHKPEEIDGYYPEAISLLSNLGFSGLMVLKEDGWEEQGLV
jgi:histidinol-phosphatase (PHP family)